MAKNNISVSELTKTTGTKDKSPLGDLEEGAVTKKAISILILSLGMAARKNLLNNISTTIMATISPADILKYYEKWTEKPKNETLDRFNIFSWKQREGETLRQFWNE